MQTFGSFLVSLIAVSGMAAAVPTERAGSTAVKAVFNPDSKPHGPSALAKARAKYGAPISNSLAKAATSKLLLSGTNGTVPASPSDEFDDMYLINVSVGNPPQEVSTVLDTGSSDFWLMTNNTPKDQSDGHEIYKPGESTTSKRDIFSFWEIKYGDGSTAAGTVWHDSTTIGGLTVENQAVESAERLTGQFSDTKRFSGILGFAFDKLNTIFPIQQKTWFSNILPRLDRPIMTINLKHQEDGSYTFGAIDVSDATGALEWVDVDSSDGFWTVSVASWFIDDKVSSTTASTGIVDTGTTLLLFEDEAVKEYYSQVSSAKVSDELGGYVFDCDETLPTFGLTFGQTAITIPSELMNYGAADDAGEICFGAMQSSEGLGLNIFGDTLLKAAVVVLDGSEQPRAGFAQK